MMWTMNYPAKKYYEYFLSLGYTDFDQIIIWTREMLGGNRPLRPLDGFMDKENQVWVVKPLNEGRFLCLCGLYDKVAQMMQYTQKVLLFNEIKDMAMPDGVVQLHYFKILPQALQNLTAQKK